nr:MAG TPA: hypothetical protein [Caudoviricetes sp.]
MLVVHTRSKVTYMRPPMRSYCASSTCTGIFTQSPFMTPTKSVSVLNSRPNFATNSAFVNSVADVSEATNLTVVPVKSLT